MAAPVDHFSALGALSAGGYLWESQGQQQLRGEGDRFTPQYFPGTTEYKRGEFTVGVVYVATESQAQLATSASTARVTSEDLLLFDTPSASQSSVFPQSAPPIGGGRFAAVQAQGARKSYTSRQDYLKRAWSDSAPDRSRALFACSRAVVQRVDDTASCLSALRQTALGAGPASVSEMRATQGGDRVGLIAVSGLSTDAADWIYRDLLQLTVPGAVLPPRQEIKLSYDQEVAALVEHLATLGDLRGWELSLIRCKYRPVKFGDDLTRCELPASPAPLAAIGTQLLGEPAGAPAGPVAMPGAADAQRPVGAGDPRDGNMQAIAPTIGLAWNGPLSRQDRGALVSVLARLYPSAAEMRHLLALAQVPVDRLTAPEGAKASIWWWEVLDRLERGLVVGGPAELLVLACEDNPGNEDLARLRHAYVAESHD